MASSHLSIGRRGEALVEKYLKKNGMAIINRGYSCRQGEVDIIARDKDVLCFIEVKTRQDISYGTAAESITSQKIRRISYAALHYLARRKLTDQAVRFDVVLVDASDQDWKIEILKDAFESAFAV